MILLVMGHDYIQVTSFSSDELLAQVDDSELSKFL